MKEIVINMIPQITNQQRSTYYLHLLQKYLTPNHRTTPHHGALLTNPYPPQLTMLTPLN